MADKVVETRLGRPRKILDEGQIARFIGKGFTVEYVADYFGVCVDTLYANYSDALRKGRVFRNGCLQAKQFHGAMKGNVTLQIWLGKQWLGQKDKAELENKQTVFTLGDLPSLDEDEAKRPN